MPGFGRRFLFACRAFFSILFHGRIAPEILEALGLGGTSAEPQTAERVAPIVPPEALTAQPAPQVDPGDRAVQMLALLQRDGRLVDFLAEDVAGYPDAQIGAAVREVHEGCRRALERYMDLEAVIAAEEGQRVTVEPGFDPASITLVGQVVGTPPLTGTLLHRGWRVTRLELPPLPPPDARRVIAPAEVEIA